MKPFRFLHAADLHLGSPFKGIHHISVPLRSRLIDAGYRALERLVDRAINEQVSFVVISGDIYDESDRSVRAQLKFQQAAIRLYEAGIGLYVCHGNHDPEDGWKAGIDWPPNVVFFDTNEVNGYIAEDSNGQPLAEIFGISFAKRHSSENLALRFPKKSSNYFTIGVLHTNVDGKPGHDPYAPCSLQDLLASGYDYWALGHIHQRQILNRQPDIVYPGNLQGRSMRETGEKGCMLVHVDSAGLTDLQFISLDDVRWLEIAQPIDEMEDEQSLKETVEKMLIDVHEENAGRSVMVRLRLTGAGPLYEFTSQAERLNDLVTVCREAWQPLIEHAHTNSPFVWLTDIRADTTALISEEEMAKEGGFAGDLLAISDKWLHMPAQEKEQLVLEIARPLINRSKTRSFMADIDQEKQQQLLEKAKRLALQRLFEKGRDMG